MLVMVNGKKTETGAGTLEQLCRELGHDQKAKIATAVNGEFVPAGERGQYSLSEGDEIEIVAPRQGG